MVPESEGGDKAAGEGERWRLCDRRGSHSQCEGEVFVARSGAWASAGVGHGLRGRGRSGVHRASRDESVSCFI